MKTFCRAEFKKVSSISTRLSFEDLNKCVVIVELLIRIFETPLKVNSIPENFYNVIRLFSPERNAYKIIYYDGVQSEFLMSAYHCKGISNFLEIFKTSETFKCVLPNVNNMLRLVYTALVSI